MTTSLRFLALAALAAFFAMSLSASTLFYNGDPNGGGIGGNFLDCSTCRSAQGVNVYDDFSFSTTSQVTGLFGYYLTSSSSPVPTFANWEIRQGISQGNSGTLIAGGTNAALSAVQIPTPVNGNASNSYWQFSVSIPSTTLGPGTYWMLLAPASSSNETFLVGTDGTNGASPLIDGQSYVIGTYWSSMQSVGGYLQPFTGHSNYDFAYGVTGQAGVSPTPELGTFAMIVTAGVMLYFGRRRLSRMARAPAIAKIPQAEGLCHVRIVSC